MKHFGKLLALALVLGAIATCAYGCVGPESDDSGVNENTDTKGTTQATTQAPTTGTTQADTSGGMVGSVADDVSEALTDDMSTQTTEAATTAPARTRGREGK